MKNRAFLIHGWEGSPEGGWFPWLKRELEEKEFEVFAPSFPNTNQPQMEEWVNHLEKIVGQVDENCYFIGHSLGAITILRYLERLKSGKAKKAILVAGFTSNLGFKELTNFFPDQGQLNWGKIRSHCEEFTAIHSDNDPLVSVHYGERFFQEHLNAKYILLPNMKHFSGGDGIFELPEVLSEPLG